jgi:hypothetical protein
MIDDVIEMYGSRTLQFATLKNAIANFNRGNEEAMWQCLFNYAMYKEEAAEIFRSFTYEDLSTMLGIHGTKIIVAGSLNE